MKIAILSDIHGNDIALEAVLEEAVLLEVEKLFILGDVVGYYYRPDKVMELLAEWSCDMIQGNHEFLLQQAIENNDEAERIRSKYGSGIKIAIERMERKELNELINLPSRKTVVIDEMQFELCHGSPWDRDVYIYPDAEPSILNRCVVPGSRIVFMGHTHYPFVYNTQNTSIVNVGSVGQARDVGGMASWALLNTSNASLIFKKTRYDVSELVNEVKSVDPHLPYLHEILKRNYRNE